MERAMKIVGAKTKSNKAKKAMKAAMKAMP